VQQQLFHASYSAMPTPVKMIDLTRIVVPQKRVNLSQVDRLRRYLDASQDVDLAGFCAGSIVQRRPIKSQRVGNAAFTFTPLSNEIRWDGGTRRSAIPDRVGVESSGLLTGNGRGWMWLRIQTRGTSHASGRVCSSLGKQPRMVDPATGRHCGKRPSDGSSWPDTPCRSTGYLMGKGVT
jgi:hypothetical protein